MSTDANRVFQHGLIGHPLAHSLSPLIHESLLAAAGLKGRYTLFDIAPEDLPSRLPGLLDELDGFNITIPHKEAIMPFLADLDYSAAEFGAVNTVFRSRGFNTDRIGFRHEHLPLAGRRILVAGAGGVSRMLVFEAIRAGGQVTVTSRTHSRSVQLAAALGAVAIPAEALTEAAPFDVILNGSPAGMWPHTGELPVPEALVRAAGCLYDTIYNPLATRLLLLGRSLPPAAMLADQGDNTGVCSRGDPGDLAGPGDAGGRSDPGGLGRMGNSGSLDDATGRLDKPTVTRNGLGMLFEQALAAERIWHPDATFPEADQTRIRNLLPGAVLSRFPLKIILNGFMGCGKSTIGQALAKRLGLPFVDLDEAIVRAAGKSIPAIFADEGEPWFRGFERRTLEQVMDRPDSLVLSVGGGALVEPAAEALVRAHPAQIVFLHVPLAELIRRLADGSGRPMLDGDVQMRTRLLYERRLPRYVAAADLAVAAVADEAAVAASIAVSLGFTMD